MKIHYLIKAVVRWDNGDIGISTPYSVPGTTAYSLTSAVLWVRRMGNLKRPFREIKTERDFIVHIRIGPFFF